jgi:hypothetical protein
MACEIRFKPDFVPVNNMQFHPLIGLGVELAQRTASSDELSWVDRMQRMRAECFWPGRRIDIAVDFPATAERKLWI